MSELGGGVGSKALDVKIDECLDRSEREALRAVLEFHSKHRRPNAKRLRPSRVARERLDKKFDRPATGRSIRHRLVHVAVACDANTYATDAGSVDELRYFVNQGLPVIVGMWSQHGAEPDKNATSATLVSANRTHYAVVVRIDDKNVELLCPLATEHTANEIAGQTVPIDEFVKRWFCVDEYEGTKPGAEKVTGWYMVLNYEGRHFAPAFEKGTDWTTPDNRRRTGIVAAFSLILVADAVLSFRSYAAPRHFTAPILAAGLALIGFTAIDFFARPEKRPYTSTLRPRWYRHLLPYWCLAPFLTASGASLWVHYEKWREARTDVRQLARELKAAVEWPDEPPADKAAPAGSATAQCPASNAEPEADDVIARVVTTRCRFATDEATNECWKAAQNGNNLERDFILSDAEMVRGTPNPYYAVNKVFGPYLSLQQRKRIAATRASERTWSCFTTERVNTKVAKLVSTRYAADQTTAEAKRFAEIARVVGHDVLTARGNVEQACRTIGLDTGSGFVLAVGLQTLFVLWVPCLLAVAISRARRRVKRSHTRTDVQASIDLRDYTILAEDQYLFLPRLGFAILLILGTNYVFAPLGLKATYLMSIVDEHALPGHTSFTLWSTSFSEAPVIVVGFVGFFLYALITATQRFVLDDLDDRALLSLLVRGLVVILLSFALSSSDINQFASRMFVFIAGVFPVRALEAIAKQVNVTIDPDFSADQGSSFAGLPGLDPIKVFALRAAGIQSTYDLAAMNIKDVAERVRIDPRLLGRAVDRAILIDAIGLDHTKALGVFGITSASELVDTQDLAALIGPAKADGNPPQPDSVDPALLLRAAGAAQARLRQDQRVRSVRGWLAANVDTRPADDEVATDP